jgi:hypothetical protein
MNTNEVLFANYSLYPHMMLLGGEQQTQAYIKKIGADGALVMPLHSRLAKDLEQGAKKLDLKEMKQTFRGEKGWKDVRRLATTKGLPTLSIPAKMAIAAFTVARMNEQDVSLEDIDTTVTLSSNIPDIMFEPTAQAFDMARRLRATNVKPGQQYLLQLTPGVLEKLGLNKLGITREEVEQALTQRNITGFSFHSRSSREVVMHNNKVNPAAMNAFAAFIKQFELTGFRSDLINLSRSSRGGDIMHFMQGYETVDTRMLLELRRYNAPLDRMVYAIPGVYILRPSHRRKIIERLRTV